MQFLQDILSGKKNALMQKDVPSFKVPHWPELSVKECYPKAIKNLPDLAAHLPDKWGKD